MKQDIVANLVDGSKQSALRTNFYPTQGYRPRYLMYKGLCGPLLRLGGVGKWKSYLRESNHKQYSGLCVTWVAWL